MFGSLNNFIDLEQSEQNNEIKYNNDYEEI